MFPKTWTPPPRRYHPLAAIHEEKGYFIVGMGQAVQEKLNDIWKFDLEENYWKILQPLS